MALHSRRATWQKEKKMNNRVMVSIELSHAQASWLYRTVMAELSGKANDAEIAKMQDVVSDVVEAVDDASGQRAELMFWAEIDQWSRTMKHDEEKAAALRAYAEDSWDDEAAPGNDMSVIDAVKVAKDVAQNWAEARA
jgi:hypothetical protein